MFLYKLLKNRKYQAEHKDPKLQTHVKLIKKTPPEQKTLLTLKLNAEDLKDLKENTEQNLIYMENTLISLITTKNNTNSNYTNYSINSTELHDESIKIALNINKEIKNKTNLDKTKKKNERNLNKNSNRKVNSYPSKEENSINNNESLKINKSIKKKRRKTIKSKREIADSRKKVKNKKICVNKSIIFYCNESDHQSNKEDAKIAKTSGKTEKESILSRICKFSFNILMRNTRKL